MSKVNIQATEEHFVLVPKNKDFAEFKVHLIHSKQVPLFHNTVLILCNEGAGLVAVIDVMHQSACLVINSVSGLRLNDDPDLRLSLVGLLLQSIRAVQHLF